MGARAAASVSICLSFRASVPGAVFAPNIYRGSGCLLGEATETLGTRRLAGYGGYGTIFVPGGAKALKSKHGHIRKGPFQPTG